MKLIRNEKGIALVMVLIFSLIGLAIVSAMLFMLTRGTMMSGSFRIFKSADEAGLGGTIDVTDMIRNRGVAPSLATLPFGLLAADPCLQQKLSIARGTTSPSGWTSCNAIANRLSMDPTAEDPNCPLDPVSNKHYCADMTVDLAGPLGTTFRTYTKIVDTVQGNSDVSALVTGGGQLGGQGVVASNSGQVSPPSVPYLHRIEVQTQNRANPNEKSRYSVLYAY